MRRAGVIRALAASPAARVAVGSLAMAIVFFAPIFRYPQLTGFGDWQMIHHNWEAAFIALTRHGEFPMWDPYHCGGVTILGNPEAQHFSPLFLLSFVLGTTLAIKVFLIVHAWIGIAGGYLLARRHHGFGHAAAAMVGVAWGCSGFFAWHLAGGHGTFAPFYLAPWLLLAWRAATRDVRYVAAVSLLMGLTVFEGGTYPFPYFVLLLGFDALVMLGRRALERLERRAGRGSSLPPLPPGEGQVDRAPPAGGVVRLLVLAAPLTGLLCAVRILPILTTLALFPRQVASRDAIGLDELVPMWARGTFPWRHPDHDYVWAEYTNYVGAIVLGLAVCGLFVAVRRRRWELLAGFFVFGAVMMGYHGAWSPWGLLHHNVPFFDSLRVPSRFTVVTTLYLVLLAGLALDEAARLVSRKLGDGARLPRRLRFLPALAPWIVACAACVHPVVKNQGVQDRWVGPQVTGAEPADRFHYVTGANYHWIYASLPRRNQGTAACYAGNMNWRVSNRLWNGPTEQVRVAGGRGTVLDWGRTTNRVWAYVRMETEGLLVANQNYHPDWTATLGVVEEDHRRLAVRLPEGTHQVELRYAPPTLVPGIVLGVLGFAGVGALLFFGRPRRRRGAA